MHYLGRYRRNNFEVNVTVSFEKSYRVSEYELLIIRYFFYILIYYPFHLKEYNV